MPAREEALKHLPQDKPDVILMDINLGDMDGIECVRRLTALMPEAQVLMLTVFEDTEQIFRALAAGASGYLLKRHVAKKIAGSHRGSVRGRLADVGAHRAQGGSVVQSQLRRAAMNRRNFRRANVRCSTGLAAGLAYKQIADQLGVSIHTVRNYIRRIYEKLHVRTRTEAVAKFLRK